MGAGAIFRSRGGGPLLDSELNHIKELRRSTKKNQRLNSRVKEVSAD